MRNGLVVLWMLLCASVPAAAQVSIGISFSLFPELVRIQGYPVYYAPRLDSNYFFYDGMYWVYQDDNWYASSWYNGPWMPVGPEAVPVYLLRVPVRYYRHPPAHFRGWQSNAPPRWDEHWGGDWSQRRRGWDHWNRGSAPAPAPLPAYQRRYAGDRYPQAEEQRALQNRNYRYQPRDPEVRQHVQAPAVQNAPLPAPQQRAAPTQAPPQQTGPAVQEQPRQPQQGAARYQQQEPKSRDQQAGTQARQKPTASERGPRTKQEDDRERAGGEGQERKR